MPLYMGDLKYLGIFKSIKNFSDSLEKRIKFDVSKRFSKNEKKTILDGFEISENI